MIRMKIKTYDYGGDIHFTRIVILKYISKSNFSGRILFVDTNGDAYWESQVVYFELPDGKIIKMR